jgi:sulfur relay (sulfurtransferase) DsrC/TusE family protein
MSYTLILRASDEHCFRNMSVHDMFLKHPSSDALKISVHDMFLKHSSSDALKISVYDMFLKHPSSDALKISVYDNVSETCRTD